MAAAAAAAQAMHAAPPGMMSGCTVLSCYCGPRGNDVSVGKRRSTRKKRRNDREDEDRIHSALWPLTPKGGEEELAHLTLPHAPFHKETRVSRKDEGELSLLVRACVRFFLSTT